MGLHCWRGVVMGVLGGLLVLGCRVVEETEPAPAAEEVDLEGRARYALCQSNVAAVTVIPVQRGSGFGVAVQLDEDATQDFGAFTKERIGDELEVVFAGLIFAKAPLRSPILSGLLIDPAFASEEQARAAREDLQARLPEEPCGIQF